MREKIGSFDAFAETVARLGQGGCLLVAGEKGNPMTIGWGTVGIVWGRPVFVVAVRPSRYTFGLMEGLSEFTVNVPTDKLKKEVASIGSESGRSVDKIRKHNLTLVRGRDVKVPYIEQCPVHYECRVIHKGNVINADLDKEIVAKSYPNGDFHRLYFGEILGVYREK
jgi:flavin reductase (DIM6/NTAB) family NADH-FMN oxidoreductase RutF